ncbi:histidine kinase [Streptomyces nigra]
MSGFVAGLCVAILPLLAAGFWLGRRTARPQSLGDLGTPVEHATFETLHTASLAAPPLRAGLTEETARKSARRLRSLLGTDALCLTDRTDVLVWDGVGQHHRTQIMELLAGPLESGRGEALPLDCDSPDCPVRWAVVAPLTVDDRVHGALVACAPRESAVLVRAAGEVARWVSVQLELADLDRSRTRLIEAEIKALRAQISPHFIFNSLAVIASFVRTDPERARELLLEFADFTRYSFRRHGDFTTLADRDRGGDRDRGRRGVIFRGRAIPLCAATNPTKADGYRSPAPSPNRGAQETSNMRRHELPHWTRVRPASTNAATPPARAAPPTRAPGGS